MSQSDLVVVQSYATEGEAEVAKGVLESSGIDDDDSGGYCWWLLVNEEDAATARKVLETLANARP